MENLPSVSSGEIEDVIREAIDLLYPGCKIYVESKEEERIKLKIKFEVQIFGKHSLNEGEHNHLKKIPLQKAESFLK